MLMTATSGAPSVEMGCRLGETSLSILRAEDDEARSWFSVHITPELLRRISGTGLAIPSLRSTLDAVIAERCAVLFPSLGAKDGWAVTFGRELNATDDRACFETSGRGLPVVEGKQIEAFRLNLAGSRWKIARTAADRRLGARYERARLAYRDVASATNRMTLIAAILPANCVSTHTLFCLNTRLSLRKQHFLCGLFNTFVLNFLVRLRVTTHVTTAIVESLPVPRQDDSPGAFREIAALGRFLARRHDGAALARLNATAARLYQLSDEEYAHILDTFPLVPREDRDAAFREFRKQN
jgi:hypothetical protein